MKRAASPDLASRLRAALRGRVTIVGVGNPLRGDDGAGSLIARSLTACANLQVIDADEVPECYAGAVRAFRPDTVLFVDAVDLGAAPGSVALLHHKALGGTAIDTHHAPLRVIMRYLEVATGAETWLLAIQPHDIGFDAAMTPEVRAAVDAAIRLLAEHAAEPRPAATAGAP